MIELLLFLFIVFLFFQSSSIEIKGTYFQFDYHYKNDTKIFSRTSRKEFLKEIVRHAPQRRFRMSIKETYKNEFLYKFKDVLQQILQRNNKKLFKDVVKDLNEKDFEIIKTGWFGFF
jgi:hypothetical protein